MFAILDMKREYLLSAIEELEARLHVPRKRKVCVLIANALIADCTSAFDLIDQLDYACNFNTDLLTYAQWETYWGDLESLLTRLLIPARRIANLGEQLRAQGEPVTCLDTLKAHITHTEKNLNWPDYGSTAKFQAMVAEAKREYIAGETEEGGWG